MIEKKGRFVISSYKAGICSVILSKVKLLWLSSNIQQRICMVNKKDLLSANRR